MQRIISYLVIFAIILLPVLAFAEYDDIKVLLNGEEIVFDQKPVMAEGDRVLVPVRLTAEKFGAVLSYDEETETVVAVVDNRYIMLQIGNTDMYINGIKKTLDVPAKEINGRTLIPVRAFAEAFNCNVSWNDTEQIVIVTR